MYPGSQLIFIFQCTLAGSHRNTTTGEEVYKDLYNTSCLNGWGFGNIGISSHDLAAFFVDLVISHFVCVFFLLICRKKIFITKM